MFRHFCSIFLYLLHNMFYSDQLTAHLDMIVNGYQADPELKPNKQGFRHQNYIRILGASILLNFLVVWWFMLALLGSEVSSLISSIVLVGFFNLWASFFYFLFILGSPIH